MCTRAREGEFTNISTPFELCRGPITAFGGGALVCPRAQPAIDALTARLQARHNVGGRAVVYSTVQVYYASILRAIVFPRDLSLGKLLRHLK